MGPVFAIKSVINYSDSLRFETFFDQRPSSRATESESRARKSGRPSLLLFSSPGAGSRISGVYPRALACGCQFAFQVGFDRRGAGQADPFFSASVVGDLVGEQGVRLLERLNLGGNLCLVIFEKFAAFQRSGVTLLASSA